jgi:glucokinase
LKANVFTVFVEIRIPLRQYGFMKKNVFAGIDLGGTFIKFGLVNMSARVIFKSSVPTPKGRNAILSEFARVTKLMRQMAQDRGLRLQAVGVGSPGIVDATTGKIIGRSPNIPGWQGAEVSKALAKATGLKVVVDNDANVMALAEHRFGSGKGFSSGLYITVGTGIGSGVILNDQIWRGAHFAGAEIGHTIIEKDGKPCKCGKRGCVEALAATFAFIEYYGRKIPEQEGVKFIFDRARQGDVRAKQAIATAADYLACGIGSALELLNPEVIVIGGGIAAGGAVYFRAIRQGLKKYASASCRQKVIVKTAQLGNDAGLIGAAMLTNDAH